MSESSLTFLFRGNLKDLLRVETTGGTVVYPLRRRSSIKDIIECLGIPHTEVGRILAGESECGFHLIPDGGERFEVYPFTGDIPLFVPTILRPTPLTGRCFLADNTVRKLARDLRMAGLDTEITENTDLQDIATEAARTQRILLSRNRELLKIATVGFGQLLRSENHLLQLDEVIARYSLAEMIAPFCRCLCCNGILEHAEKADIIEFLEPLTRKYYNNFKRCGSCGRIYWRGSHHQRMADMLRRKIE